MSAPGSSTKTTGANRIGRRFAALRAEGRAGLITFVMAGDPDRATSLQLLRGLPEAGADLIEIGFPFSDPMADGPAIQAAGGRARRAGTTLRLVIDLVRAFRTGDAVTPIVLMGYFNPIYRYGVPAFLTDAKAAGIDGLIVIDLPPEEDDELCMPARAAGIDFVRLTAPTTDEVRLPAVLGQASGFVYYVSIAGITGTKSASATSVEAAIARLRRHTDLPIAVGFGIRTAEQAAAVARHADAAVVGSAIVEGLAAHLDEAGRARPDALAAVLAQVRTLAAAIRCARVPAGRGPAGGAP